MEIQERVSLGRFAQFALATSAQRRAMVADHRRLLNTVWSPITDPYRFLINAIVAMHRDGSDASALDSAITRERSVRRRTVIEDAAADYLGWLTAVNPSGSFPVASVTWRCGNACVRVNPELGLEINGTRYVVKLHFVKRSLSRDEAALMTVSMRAALGSSVPADCKMAVLDVRSGVLYIEPRYQDRVLRRLRAAADDLAEVWTTTR